MGLINCWFCEEAIEDTLKDCPHCKMPVIIFPSVKQASKEEQKPELCKQCGGPMPENAAFCPKCGVHVNAEESTPKKEESVEKAIESPAKSTTKITNNGTSKNIHAYAKRKHAEKQKKKGTWRKAVAIIATLSVCIVFVVCIKTAFDPENKKYAHSSSASYKSTSSKPKTNTSSSSTSSTTTSSYKPSTVSTPKHTEEDICYCATVIVESYLPTPSTAKFCMYSEMKTQDLGNNHYQCTGWVDCENLYGAMVRYNFIAYYTAEGQGFKEGGAELFLSGY